MPLTKEQRLELLARAREAKKQKAAEKGAVSKPKKADIVEPELEIDIEQFEPEPVKKVRKPRVKKEPVKTLELKDDVKVDTVDDVVDDTIVEEVVEVRKKPKKKIVKKIVYESASEEDVEEIVEVKSKPKQPRAVKLEKPREVDITQSTPQFNFFGN